MCKIYLHFRLYASVITIWCFRISATEIDVDIKDKRSQNWNDVPLEDQLANVSKFFQYHKDLLLILPQGHNLNKNCKSKNYEDKYRLSFQMWQRLTSISDTYLHILVHAFYYPPQFYLLCLFFANSCSNIARWKSINDTYSFIFWDNCFSTAAYKMKIWSTVIREGVYKRLRERESVWHCKFYLPFISNMPPSSYKTHSTTCCRLIWHTLKIWTSPTIQHSLFSLHSSWAP